MGTSESEPERSSGKMPFSTRDDSYSELGENVDKALKCSYKTRLIGFIACCGIGWFLSILGTLSLIFHHNLVQFSILYSTGQISNIVGSCFLAGPKKQAKSMVQRSRIVFSACYIGLILLTLVLGLLLEQKWTWIVILCLVAQMISYFLYTLTYVPFGRKIIKKICCFMMQ